MDEARLLRLLGGPDLRWVVERARRRLEAGRPLEGTTRLREPGAEQRRAVDRLLGRRPSRAATLSVDLAEVDRVLREVGLADGLAGAVERLTGPVEVAADVRAAEQRAWDAAVAPLTRLVGDRPRLEVWHRRLVDQGVLRRVAGDAGAAAGLVADLVRVVEALPVAQPVGLSTFAADVLGDAHALDVGRALHAPSVAVAAALGDVADGSGRTWRREAWQAVGVVVDELAAPALALGLPGDEGASVTGDLLGRLAAVGEPVHLTRRLLVRHPPCWGGALVGHDVFVCENPAVVAAAADAGGRCAPLVCTGGWPSGAVTLLLDLLQDAGARLRCHADLDGGGLRIVEHVVSRHTAVPWRMTTDDYRAALRRGSPTRRLPAELPETAWDPDLRALMQVEGVAVEEESVLDDLLGDVCRQGDPGLRSARRAGDR